MLLLGFLRTVFPVFSHGRAQQDLGFKGGGQTRALLAVANYREEDRIFQPLGQGLVIIPSLHGLFAWRGPLSRPRLCPIQIMRALSLLTAYPFALDASEMCSS